MSGNKRQLIALCFVILILIPATLAAQTAPQSRSTLRQDSENIVVIPPDETVQIGLATPLSGDTLPEAGTDVRNAALLAFSAYNEAGGLNGFVIEVLIEDDQCNPELASTVAEYFVEQPNIVGILGHLCSGATAAGLEYYEEVGIPVVSPSATAASLTSSGSEVFSRVIFNDAAQGTVAARYIHDVLEINTIAVLNDGDAYGKGLADIVAATFSDELGGEVVYNDVVLTAEASEGDYSELLEAIAETEPELIYFGGYGGEASLLVEQMQEFGLGDVLFFSGDGVKTEAFIEGAGDFSEGVYASSAVPGGGSEEANIEFDTMYEEIYGVPPDVLGPFHAQAYDSASVLLAALEEVAVVDDDGNLIIDRDLLTETIRSTSGYDGLSGTITCDEFGDCGESVIQVFHVEDGVYVEQEVPEELQGSASDG